MQTLQAGVVYFILVFAAGFIWGPIRIFWMVPRVGRRNAEFVRRADPAGRDRSRGAMDRSGGSGVPSTTSKCPGIGLVALALLITPERGVALGL